MAAASPSAADDYILETRALRARTLVKNRLRFDSTSQNTWIRSAFAGALKLDPLRARNIFRFIRTFLPLRIARLLSGRTGKGIKSAMREPLR